MLAGLIALLEDHVKERGFFFEYGARISSQVFYTVHNECEMDVRKNNALYSGKEMGKK